MKILNSLKKDLVLVFLLFISTMGYAQFLRTSYFMEGIHYRQQLNPALVPGRGYLNLPVIGSLNATVNSSLGYQDVLDIIDNSSESDYFMSSDFMNRLGTDNNLNLNLSTDVLSAGWYKGRNFWSFNIGLRNDIGASIPRSMFQFLNDMDGLDAYDWNTLRHINSGVGLQSVRINSYAEAGLGLARRITDRLIVGARVKALLGIANMKLDIHNIQVQSQMTGLENYHPQMNSEELAHIHGKGSIKVDASLETSSKLLELNQNPTTGYIDDIDFGTFGFAGYGGAIDLGASFKLTKHLTLSASVLDLGFIKWSKKNTTLAKASEKVEDREYIFDGNNPNSVYEFVDRVSGGEILNYNLMQMEVQKGVEKDRTTSLSSTIVVGAEYELLGDWFVVGALYTSRFAKPKTLNELTFSATIRPKNNFNLAVSYSMLQGAGKTMGAAVKLGSLFVGTDYMFFGKNTKNVNAYVGCCIHLNKPKKF